MIGFGRTPCDEGVVRGGRGTAGCAERSRPWVLAATILGSALGFIDGAVVNVALPAIQADLGASIEGAQWVVNGYMLMLGALTLVGGAAADRFGRRRVFAAGVILFTAASVACGLAPSTGALIAARFVQGVGGALLVPSSLAIISAAFPEETRGKAIGTWAGFSALTTALGPILGGALVDALSWRAIFFINVPLAAVTLAITFTHVPESRDNTAAGLDWRGGLLATVGLAALAYGLTAASQQGWSDAAVLGSLVASVLVLAAFVWWEARAPDPILPLGLFRSPMFTGANLLTLLLYFALGGALFFLPFNLIHVQAYSATQAGAAFLPFTVIMGTLSRWSGGLIARTGAKLPLTVGPVTAAAGFALLALPGIGGSYWTTFFPATVVLGFGMAITAAPLTTAVMDSVDQRHAGTASGVNNAVARIAGTLAVALLGTLAVGLFGSALSARLDGLRVSPDVRTAMLAQAGRLVEAQVPPVDEPTRHLLEQAIAGAFVHTFHLVMLISAALALASALCAALTPANVHQNRNRRIS
ncbi:MAG: MFS transporter [Bradyrhizobiaceae bacterium]|nr:MFS transporter [Hyphomicrobiales bacterium]MBV9426184.1 MFS transporter [Bradyrhizobiaceae bacterium]